MKRKPKFSIGQVVAERCEPPKFGRIDIAMLDDSWSGGIYYHFEGEPLFAPKEAGGGKIGSSEGTLRRLTAKEAGRA